MVEQRSNDAEVVAGRDYQDVDIVSLVEIVVDGVRALLGEVRAILLATCSPPEVDDDSSIGFRVNS